MCAKTIISTVGQTYCPQNKKREFLTHVEPLHRDTKQLGLPLGALRFLQPLFLMIQLSQLLHIQGTALHLLIRDEQGSVVGGLVHFHMRDLETLHLIDWMY
jgi:hypothetical protein